jgi:uncharacterized membrane protein YczE
MEPWSGCTLMSHATETLSTTSSPAARRVLLGRRTPAGLLRDAAMLLGGLFIFATGQLLSLQCNLGANSWTVLHDGISRHTPLTIGEATQVVGLLMVVVSWVAGVRPGLGTIANMLLVGFFLDLQLRLDIVPRVDPYPLRVLLLLGSVATIGIASALYIKAGFGAGPRDSFMLAMTRRGGWRVGRVRWLMELSAVALGIVLGGRFGVGTLIFAMLIGFAVDTSFRVFHVRSGRRPPAPAPVAD